MKIHKVILLLLSFFLLLNCNEDYVPKPYGEVLLTYPENSYQTLNTECPFIFEYSDYAIKTVRNTNCSYNIVYPDMKSTIHLQYFSLDSVNLYELIRDSEKSVYEPHTARAEYIRPQIIAKPGNNVYGTMYELGGQSALNFQFHLTDSTQHFLRGAVYFSTQPKPDSLKPAFDYLKKDVMHLMESTEWK